TERQTERDDRLAGIVDLRHERHRHGRRRRLWMDGALADLEDRPEFLEDRLRVRGAGLSLKDPGQRANEDVHDPLLIYLLRSRPLRLPSRPSSRSASPKDGRPPP